MVRSMRGKDVDMAQLVRTNGGKVALGNASLNARGDKVNKKGQVLVRSEQRRAYYANNPKAVKQVSLKDLDSQVFQTPAEAMTAIKEHARKSSKKIADE